MSKYYNKNKIDANRKFIYLITILFLACLIICLFINLFIDTIVIYFTKENIYEVSKILKILSISFIFNVIYEFLINQYLVVNKLFYEINKAKSLILLSCISIGIPMIFFRGVYGAAITNLIYESVGLTYAFRIYFKTYKLNK